MDDFLKDFSLRQTLPALKLFALLTLVGIGWFLLKESPLGAAIQDYQWVRLKITESGAWGSVLFIVSGALLTVIGLPRVPVSLVAGFVFGFLKGFAFALLAALTGAVVTFYLARCLGRDFFAKKLPESARKYEALLGEHSFSMTLVIRFFPVGHNTLTNLVAGISAIRPLPFFLGSALGFIPQTAIFAMMGSGFGDQPLLRSTMAAGLFLASLLMMYVIIQRIRRAGPPAMADETENAADIPQDAALLIEP
jgi:uncharacterized membrane protein YdjX (TVP38/TMEM64 family)